MTDATVIEAEAPAAPPEPAELEAFFMELHTLDVLLRERGTSVRDLLCVTAKNAFGISDLR